MSEQWRDAVALADLQRSGNVAVDIDGVQVGLFLVDDQIFAIDNICTHGQACLTDGMLEGFLVECPLHAGLVDLRSGKAAGAPITRDTRVHTVKVDDGRVWVRISEAV